MHHVNALIVAAVALTALLLKGREDEQALVAQWSHPPPFKIETQPVTATTQFIAGSGSTQVVAIPEGANRLFDGDRI